MVASKFVSRDKQKPILPVGSISRNVLETDGVKIGYPTTTAACFGITETDFQPQVRNYRIVMYRTVPYRIVPYRTVKYRTVPYRTVKYRTVQPWHAVS